MGDSDRSGSSGSRRVGDETRKRIDDLADGWSAPRKPEATDLDDGDTERVEREEPAEVAPPRAKRVSQQPPPMPRAQRESEPPPVPRAQRESQPPPVPRAQRESESPPAPRAKRVSQPPPTPPAPPAAPRPAPVEVREDPTLRRDDPTSDTGADATLLQIDAPGPTPAAARGTRAREPVSVPRERGVLGDMRYVFAALFGVARARSELAQIEERLTHERDERDRALIAVARYTVGNPRYDQPAVEQAREQLAELEEQRSRHAGAVAGADEEIAGLERARAAAREAFEAEDQRFDTELQAIATQLAPLEKAAAEVRKRIAALKTTAAALDKRIKSEEKKLVTVAKKDDPVAVEANLAGVRAEREAVLADEPALAADLDEIEPKIAGLNGSRAELEKQRAAARQKEETDTSRTAERIKAAEARRQVEQNAVDDTDRERDQALLALGERLDVDRPDDLPSKLGGAEEHDVEIATLERKHLELKELVEGVDRLAFARGVGYWLLLLGLIAGAVWLALGLR